MITLGKRWMAYLRSWVSGQKHPDTPRTVFMNCYEYDRVRRILRGRCRSCGYVISEDEKAVKEIAFVCADVNCNCHKMYGPISHRVCSLCYDVFHSLYVNYKLKNVNYFKQIDEKEKADRTDNFNKRDKLGI